MEKQHRKCAPKASPRPFLILVSKTAIPCKKFFSKLRYIERIIKKP